MPAAEAPARRRLRARHKALLAVVACALGLLALEGAVRVRHYLKHGSFGPIYDFVSDEASGLTIPAPGAHGRIVCDSFGFRSPELERPKPDSVVRIAFLGGSTTFCAEASGNQTTWPHLVVEALRQAHPERSFDHANAAAAGYAVEHSVTNLRYRVAPIDPDVIVIYHGTNDLTKDARAVAVERGLWEPEQDSTDWLERYSMLWEILKKNLLLRARSEGPDAATASIPTDPEELAAGFEARLEGLVRAAQEVAPVTVLVTFAHRARADQSPDDRAVACQSALYYMPFLTADDIFAGIAAYNDAIRRVAARTGAVLVDGEDRIPADAEHFSDSVHLLDAGCRLQAERIAEALLADGVLAPALR